LWIPTQDFKNWPLKNGPLQVHFWLGCLNLWYDVPLKIVSLPVFELVLAMSNICSIVHIQKLIRYNSNYSLLFTLFFEINIAASALAYILPLFMLFPDSDVECCCTFRRLHFSSLPPASGFLHVLFITWFLSVCV